MLLEKLCMFVYIIVYTAGCESRYISSEFGVFYVMSLGLE